MSKINTFVIAKRLLDTGVSGHLRLICVSESTRGWWLFARSTGTYSAIVADGAMWGHAKNCATPFAAVEQATHNLFHPSPL